MGAKNPVILAVGIAAFLGVAKAASPADVVCFSQTEIKRLLQTANKPADYQQLAAFFHLREEVYVAKAQSAMDDYASCARHMLMAPKFPTRADATFRLYEYYSAKAEQQAKLAAHYEEMLISLGIRPVHSTPTVSLNDLDETGVVPKTRNEFCSKRSP